MMVEGGGRGEIITPGQVTREVCTGCTKSKCKTTIE